MFKKKKTTETAPPAAADSGLDRIAEYIRSVTLRKQLFGVNAEDLWTVVSNIQKYYERKSADDEVLIRSLKEDLSKKDELIVKQKMYIEAVRRKGNDS